MLAAIDQKKQRYLHLNGMVAALTALNRRKSDINGVQTGKKLTVLAFICKIVGVNGVQPE